MVIRSLHPDSLTVNGQKVPWDIPLLVGDILFSLRSSLDCCWMGLQRSIGSDSKKTLPRGSSQAEVEATARKSGLAERYPDIVTFISTQIRPFREGNYILWLVAQFDNWNKHNMLIASLAQNKFAGEVKAGNAIVEIDFTVLGQSGVGKMVEFGSGDAAILTRKPTVTDLMLRHDGSEPDVNLMDFIYESVAATRIAVELFIQRYGGSHQAV